MQFCVVGKIVHCHIFICNNCFCWSYEFIKFYLFSDFSFFNIQYSSRKWIHHCDPTFKATFKKTFLGKALIHIQSDRNELANFVEAVGKNARVHYNALD